MIKERYCSFEISKLLREKGFNEPIAEFYNSSGVVLYARVKIRFRLSELSGVYYPHITHQMACDWLRNKGYHIEIYANASGYRFIISKTPPDGTDLVCDVEGNNNGGAWDDYGECEESAIKYCLTKLVKGGVK